MGWWKADPEPPPPLPTSIATPIPPTTAHPVSSSVEASACPVDHTTRRIWMQAAQKREKGATQTEHAAAREDASVLDEPQFKPVSKSLVSLNDECSSERIENSATASVQPFKNMRPLSIEREVSTIPRANILSGPSTTGASYPSGSVPSNAEIETGHDKSTGNWIYPSESQFFNAVLRKSDPNTSPKELATSISSIIPIHNAVNERAWHQIKLWEAHHPSNKSCGGPKLLRFEGKGAGAKSPRAIMKSWSGYQEPFDRHDWTIQRCDGTEVEYVIDFYQGRSPAGQTTPAGPQNKAGMGGINFYLDVRPKLNSFEGCRLRLEKAVGWR